MNIYTNLNSVKEGTESRDDDSSNQKKTIVRKSPIKPRKYPSEISVRKSGKEFFETRYFSKPSPEANSGFEGGHTPSNSGNGASCDDFSSMEREDLGADQDIDIGFDSNEDYQSCEADRDGCSSSALMLECDQSDEETADAPGVSEKMLAASSVSLSDTPTTHRESWPNDVPCIEIGKLPTTMVRTIVRALREELEYTLNSDEKQHLIEIISTINMARYREPGELVGSANRKHDQELATATESGHFNEMPTLEDVGKCSYLLYNIINYAGTLMETSVKLQEAGFFWTEPGKELMDDTEEFNSRKQLMNDTEDSDSWKKPMEDLEKLDTAQEIISCGKLLMKAGKELKKDAEEMDDVVTKWEDFLRSDLSYCNEDLGSGGSFPTFLANFLLISALFAVLVVPALFAKYASSDKWLSIFGFNISDPDSLFHFC